MDRVSIVEVGPRDGFQAVKPFIPTALKIEIARGLIESGLRRIEIGSFVSPSALPQMADVREVLAAVQDLAEPSVLVPNLKGAELAMRAGVENLVFVVSVSEAHNAGNVRQSVAASMQAFARLVGELKPQGRIRLNLATAFDCPYEGRMPPARTLSLVEQALELSPGVEIALCDTTGRASPGQVQALFRAADERFGARAWAYHGHDTYGLGLAGVMAAYASGARVFDASIAGLGGCPFAPGATGNVATEDVVFMFETSDVDTGVDLRRLISTATVAAGVDGGQVGGRVRDVAARRAAAAADRRGLARDALLDA